MTLRPEKPLNMQVYRRSQYVKSISAILKLVQMTVVLLGMVLFLINNNCAGLSNYITLFVLPCVVCLCLTFISFITGLLVLSGGRNPFTTPTWIKGDIWFNVWAMAVMLVGSFITLSNESCSNSPLTLIAIGLGFIGSAVYLVAAGVACHLIVQYKELVRDAHGSSHTTISSIT